MTRQSTGKSGVSIWMKGLAGVVSLAVPRVSLACSVCMTGRDDDTRLAFEFMTAFMTVMPFILVGAVFWWFRGRLKQLEAMHEKARMAHRDDLRTGSQRTSSPVAADG